MAVAQIHYALNLKNANSSHGTLQFWSQNTSGGRGAPATATMTLAAWQPGAGSVATSKSSDMAFGTTQVAASFSTTLGPSAATGTTKCFASETPLQGAFAATAWTFSFSVIMSTVATSGTGNLRLRVYRGTVAAGTGATELTASTLVTSTFNLHTATAQTVTATWSPGAVSLAGEFLFVAVAFEVVAGAVNVTATKCALQQNATSTRVTTPVFTPVSTICLVGTGQSQSAIAGTDGMFDQVYAGSAFAQIFPAGTSHNRFGATCTFDPVNCPSDMTNGGSGTFYLFDNEDTTGTGGNECYHPGTNTSQALGPVMPTNCAGYGAGAVLNGVSYCIGGGQQDTPLAVSGVCSWNNAQAAATGVFVAKANLPTAACNMFAVAHPGLGLIFHGGGDACQPGAANQSTQLATPQCLSTWYSWNPATDVHAPLHAMPGVLAGAACILIDNDTILIVGGFSVSQGFDFSTFGLTNVWKYSIAGDAWTTMQAFPVGAAFAAGFVWNGIPTVVSGWTSAGNGGGNLPANNTVYQYDPMGDSWTVHSTLITGTGNTGIIAFGAAAINGTPTIVAGTTRGAANIANVAPGASVTFTIDMPFTGGAKALSTLKITISPPAPSHTLGASSVTLATVVQPNALVTQYTGIVALAALNQKQTVTVTFPNGATNVTATYSVG